MFFFYLQQIRKSIASVPDRAGLKEEKVGFSSASLYTPPRRQSRTSSDNSGTSVKGVRGVFQEFVQEGDTFFQRGSAPDGT